MSYAKIVGAVLIFTASMLSALRLNRYFDSSAAVTEGILLLLKYIKMRIELNRAPLDEIIKSFDCAALEEEGILKRAREGGLAQAVLFAREARLIDGEEYRILKSFTDILGKGLAESEGERCAVCIEGYGRAADDKKNRLEKKKKITLAAAAAFAALITILLI